MEPITIRRATLDDTAALLSIESACFSGDRISRRSFHHLLRAPTALPLVEEQAGTLRGYILLLFRAGCQAGRIYSIATAPACHGLGVAGRLLHAAEGLAAGRNCTRVRLEIRQDNLASLTLFRRRGYTIFGEYEAYYADGMDAYRLEREIIRPVYTERASI